ncbi:MAG: Gfo/Idh/MocA family oxidoreductase [Lentisphaerae bacterium]|nr:Gfo/Idh/MocA family oxidoreductase [Lentisphaerota bacterium]
MKKIRLGHIGWLSRDEASECQTVAWCDVNEAKMKKAEAENPDIAMYTDYRAMLKHPDLDAVVIATPNFVHAEQAIAFLEAGKDVFLEKPMGINAQECDAILKAATKNKRICVIDFEMRVSPFAQRLQELLAGGQYGALKHIEFVHHRGCWLAEGNGLWRVDPLKSGGLFFMEVIHAVDIFRFLGGEILSVQSTAAPTVLPQYQFQDNVCSHFFFKSGALGTILSSHTHSAWTTDAKAWPALGHEMQMIFTLDSGSIGVNFIQPRILINRFEQYPIGSPAKRVVFDRAEDHTAMGSHAFAHDIDKMRWEFIRRLANSQPPVQTTLDAWKTHRVCLAAEQSVRENFRRVEVDYTLPAGIVTE